MLFPAGSHEDGACVNQIQHQGSIRVQTRNDSAKFQSSRGQTTILSHCCPPRYGLYLTQISSCFTKMSPLIVTLLAFCFVASAFHVNDSFDYSNLMLGPFGPPEDDGEWPTTRSSLLSDSRKRRAKSSSSRTEDHQDLLVQTLNGLVRGTRKSALGESVDVFLGVSQEGFSFILIGLDWYIAFSTLSFKSMIEVHCDVPVRSSRITLCPLQVLVKPSQEGFEEKR